MSYTVVEVHQDGNGTLVTFAERTFWDWVLRRPASETFQAHTDPGGYVWHAFPSMHRVSIETECVLQRAFNQHQLLEKYSNA